MFEAGVVRAYECYSQRQVRRHSRNIFSISFNLKVHCMFSLESPHRGDSNEYTQYTIFNIKKEKSHSFIPNLQLWDFSKGLKNEFKITAVNDPSMFNYPCLEHNYFHGSKSVGAIEVLL